MEERIKELERRVEVLISFVGPLVRTNFSNSGYDRFVGEIEDTTKVTYRSHYR